MVGRDRRSALRVRPLTDFLYTRGMGHELQGGALNSCRVNGACRGTWGRAWSFKFSARMFCPRSACF